MLSNNQTATWIGATSDNPAYTAHFALSKFGSAKLLLHRNRYEAEPTPLSSTVIETLLKAQPAPVPEIPQQS